MKAYMQVCMLRERQSHPSSRKAGWGFPPCDTDSHPLLSMVAYGTYRYVHVSMYVRGALVPIDMYMFLWMSEVHMVPIHKYTFLWMSRESPTHPSPRKAGWGSSLCVTVTHPLLSEVHRVPI